MKVSRKKYQEVLKLTKEMCKNPKLPYVQRLRAAELTCLVYGLNLSWCDTKADRKTVRELVSQRQSVDKYVKQTVQGRVQEEQELEQQVQEEQSQQQRVAQALALLKDGHNAG